MAATPTPKQTLNNPAQAALAAMPAVFDTATGIAIAFSGGADSTALLMAAAQRWPGRVQAIHIHHGLQAAADDFVRVCELVCASLHVPLELGYVNAVHAPGQSPEDAARRARYSALAHAATKLNLNAVLLGQHADDQAETVILALSRGAGLPGLSAMAVKFMRHNMWFYRPLLQTPAASLRAWLIQESIPFVDDPSNSDQHYTRNRIRARLLPVLAETFPQFRETFARSARHAAQAHCLLLEVAVEDLARIGVPPVIKTLQQLSKARQANVIRHWLLNTCQATPSAAQLDQLLSQISACTTRGHRLHLKVATGHIVRAGDVLSYVPSIKTSNANLNQ